MFLIIDNTKNLEQAKMTPKIVNILKLLKLDYLIISTKKQLILFLKDKIFINGIILSGGPLCLSESCYYSDIVKNIVALNISKHIPILGICFGFQVICDIYGSKILKLEKEHKQIKKSSINSEKKLLLFKNLPNNSEFFFCHKDYVSTNPLNFNVFKYKHMILGIENLKKKIFGFQFHPEGTKDGNLIIVNFFNFCLNKNLKSKF